MGCRVEEAFGKEIDAAQRRVVFFSFTFLILSLAPPPPSLFHSPFPALVFLFSGWTRENEKESDAMLGLFIAIWQFFFLSFEVSGAIK